MRFKAEIFLLLAAIVLFTASAFLYSYEPISKGLSFAMPPYRNLAISFVGFGSALMIVASVSYSERSKNPI